MNPVKFKSYFPKYSYVVFIVCLLGMAFLFNYHKIIRLKPTSIHQWRQADCWSFAVNYYEEGLNFFKPSLHFIGKSNTGNASGEFPIIYYTVAQIWKLTGPKAWLFRGFNIFIVFAGLLALFKLFEKIVMDSVWAIMLTLLLFTSPILVFYTNNFIADAPALGFSFLGAYFFYGFYVSKSQKKLYVACVFFLLGALLKVTAAILFIAILVIYVVEIVKLFKFKGDEKLFDKPIKQGIPLLLVIVFSFSWYSYSAYYNALYNGEYFLLGILPVWDMDYPLINQITRILNENLVYQFFSISVISVVVGMLVLLIIFRKNVNKLLLILSLLLLMGGFFYMMLWFRVFDVHDYYLLNLLIIVVLVFITFFAFIRQNYPLLLKVNGLKWAFLIFLCYNIYYSRAKNAIKYEKRGEKWAYSFINRTNELEYWGWLHWYSETYMKAYETVTPYLRSLGISRNDRVISISDHSPNITLSLMDQKGVTDFGKSIEDADRVNMEIRRGAKYLIINNPDYYKKDFIQPFIKRKIGTYMNIDIFDLR